MAKKVNKTIARGLAIKMVDTADNLRDTAVNALTELYLADSRFFRMDSDINKGHENLAKIVAEVKRIEAEHGQN